MRHAALLAGLAALALGAPACSKPQSAADQPVSTAVELPVIAPELPVMPRFWIGNVDLHAVGAPAELPDSTQARVHGLLDRYLNNAVVIPLKTGERIGDLSSVFMRPALDRMDGDDRAALVDEGMSKAQRVDVTTATADLLGLIGPDGIVVLAAEIRLVVTADVGGTPVTIERTGELLLSPERDAWKISGYSIRATRGTPAGVTTSTVQQ